MHNEFGLSGEVGLVAADSPAANAISRTERRITVILFISNFDVFVVFLKAEKYIKANANDG
jgi:hypothetical protein